MSHVIPAPVKLGPLALVAILLGTVTQTPVWVTVLLGVMGSTAVIAAALISRSSVNEKLGRLEQKLDDHMTNHGFMGIPIAHTELDPPPEKVATKGQGVDAPRQ